MKAALIGQNIGASLTPDMHMAEAKAQGFSYEYCRFDAAKAPYDTMPLKDILHRAETGGMVGVPPTAENRYQAIADYADAHGIDLRESVAYADSASDLPMLEAVGFPVAVNPETKLASIARKRGWLVEDFQKQAGAPRRPIPLAPRTGARQEPMTTRLMSAYSTPARPKTRR